MAEDTKKSAETRETGAGSVAEASSEPETALSTAASLKTLSIPPSSTKADDTSISADEGAAARAVLAELDAAEDEAVGSGDRVETQAPDAPAVTAERAAMIAALSRLTEPNPVGPETRPAPPHDGDEKGAETEAPDNDDAALIISAEDARQDEEIAEAEATEAIAKSEPADTDATGEPVSASELPVEEQPTQTRADAQIVSVSGAAAIISGKSLDARMAASAPAEPAKRLQITPTPAERVDPRVAQTATRPSNSTKDNSAAWFWGLPLVIVAGLVGLMAMPPGQPEPAKSSLVAEPALAEEPPVVASMAPVSVRSVPEETAVAPGEAEREATGTTQDTPTADVSGEDVTDNQPNWAQTFARNDDPDVPTDVVEPAVAAAAKKPDSVPASTSAVETPAPKGQATTTPTPSEKPGSAKGTPNPNPAGPKDVTAASIRVPIEAKAPPRAPQPVKLARASAPGVSKASASLSGAQDGISPPERRYLWPIEPGSAAAIAIELTENATNRPLGLEESRSLAVRVERTLDTEIDGRMVALRVAPGQVLEVRPIFTADARRSVSLARSAAIAPLDAFAKVEGGWFAVRAPTPLRPVTHLHTRLATEDMGAGTLAERLATVTDLHGERWFLVGRDGQGLGYVPAADVTPLDTFAGRASAVLKADTALSERDTVDIMTTCRLIDLRVSDAPPRSTTVCRQPDGRWLAEPAIGPQLARFSGTPRSSESGNLSHRLLNITLPIAGGSVSVINTEAFRRDFNDRLRAAPDGIPLSFVLPGDTRAQVLAIFSRTETRAVAIQRAAELGQLPEGLQVSVAWVETRNETELRPRPSQATEMVNGTLPGGTLLQEMARFTDGSGLDWSLVGSDGVAFGYIARQDLVSVIAEPGLRFKNHRRAHGRIVRDLVQADVNCRDLELSGDALASQALTACQTTSGDWIVEDSANALAAAPGAFVFERLLK